MTRPMLYYSQIISNVDVWQIHPTDYSFGKDCLGNQIVSTGCFVAFQNSDSHFHTVLIIHLHFSLPILLYFQLLRLLCTSTEIKTIYILWKSFNLIILQSEVVSFHNETIIRYGLCLIRLDLLLLMYVCMMETIKIN